MGPDSRRAPSSSLTIRRRQNSELVNKTESPRGQVGAPLRGLRQSVCDEVIAGLSAERPMAAGGDNDVLSSVGGKLVGHRCGLASCRQTALPDLVAGFDVKGAYVRIARRANEYQPRTSNERAPHVRDTQSQPDERNG
jgi:hypothetical protein